MGKVQEQATCFEKELNKLANVLSDPDRFTPKHVNVGAVLTCFPQTKMGLKYSFVIIWFILVEFQDFSLLLLK